MNRKKQLLPVLAVAAVVSLAGCSSTAMAGSVPTSTTTSSAPSAAASSSASASIGAADGMSMSPSAESTIHIHDFGFQAPAAVAPGAKVNVMNMDAEAHTVTSDDGTSFDVTAAPGAMPTLTAPDKPGSYPFHCKYHSNMHGVLVVK